MKQTLAFVVILFIYDSVTLLLSQLPCWYYITCNCTISNLFAYSCAFPFFGSSIFGNGDWSVFSSQTVTIFLQSMPQVLIISMVVRGAESAGDLFLYRDKMNLAELWILILSSCLPFNSFIYFSVCMSHRTRCSIFTFISPCPTTQLFKHYTNRLTTCVASNSWTPASQSTPA